MIKKFKKGFTLIELVVVIAVIAILSAISVISYVSITNKAKQSNDEQKINQVNLSLTAGEVSGKPQTMYDALKVADADGFGPDRFKAESKNYTFAYKMSKNRFVILEKEKVVYPKDIETGDKADLWVFSDKGGDLRDGYSHYLRGEINEEVKVNAGVDVGENANIPNIEYTNSAAAQEVIIRTNSAGTALSIDGYVDSTDSTKGDIIYHYGSAGLLKVVKCALGSFHENGKVAFLEVSNGRIVLEKKAGIDQLHINANTDKTGYGEVVIKDNGVDNLPGKITRDAVEITAETKVVTINSANGSVEVVKAYPDGTSGTTEKTATQNTSVESSLGQLVLDNGSESKALSDEIKEAEKTAVIEQAVTKEVEDSVEEDEYALYEARIGKKGYVSFRTALDEAKSGETVVLLKDADLVTEYGITKSLTIFGGGHTVRASTATAGYGAKREGRVFDISDVSNLNVTFANLNVIGESTGVRGISLYGTANINLTLSDCSVTSNYYAINVASKNTGLHVTLKNNTFSTGYCAIQSWSAGAVFDILGGTLEGINDKSYNSDGWNNFSTIVINSDATNNVWNLSNVTVKAKQATGNKQTLMSFRSASTTVNLNNCSFFVDDVEIEDLQGLFDNCTFTSYEAISGLNINIDGEHIDLVQ